MGILPAKLHKDDRVLANKKIDWHGRILIHFAYVPCAGSSPIEAIHVLPTKFQNRRAS